MRLLALTNTAIDTAAARADASDVTVATPSKPTRKPRAPKLAKPATVAAEPTGPVLDLTPVEPVAPANAAPTAPAAEPAVTPATDTPRVAPIARTCATIAAQATNFGGVLSDRDHAYITYYAALAKAASDGVVTVRAIADLFTSTGQRPAYSGSSKPHDAGVIVRLTKAGIIATEADGTSFRFTDRGISQKSYAAA